MDAALRQTAILGVTTNVRFLRDVLAHPAFQRGEVTTNFIEREFAAWRPDASDKLDIALIAAALNESQSAPVLPTTNNQLPVTGFDPWQAGDGFRIGG
jgi:acetyl-CoA/propionyl-CoA carboxylase biotin carboxyl carrier protein